ncbi:twin-arginine translocation signal domain-containing protein [Metapseudomonas resinovorans]|uniref:twin-arginine translocation signal domain-containing protein n=1 Tax=Metapseudomonas resinovorans TaxID=53412 RepID=UPI00042370BE|nr:twin-arginine translocation signal domain-containing protein [Pseudomonas resinovorans]
MNRRNFLKTSLAGATLPALTATSGLSLADAFDAWSGDKASIAVSDARFHQSRLFGSAAEQAGLRHLAIDGDVTALWFEHLDPLWRKHRVVIAGMTARQPLFVLERLAWERDMRVVLRIEHDWTANGLVDHQLEAPQHQLPHLTELLNDHADWSERLARLGANCTWSNQGACNRSAVTSPAVRQGDRTAPLVSWIIAPARNA